MQAVHVRHLKNPSRDYPLSVLIATILVVVIFVLGTLAVGVVIAQKDINLAQSLLIAYRDLWAALSLPWMGNVMAAMLAFGVLGQVSVIVAGPSTGLLAVGKAGYLPHALQKTNAHGVPVSILLFQGALVTILCFAVTVLPSVQSAYQILGQMATIIYLVMYLVMYVAAIRLRYTQPDKLRPFKIPGGNIGMWLVGIIGLLGALVALAISFVPPTQISTGSPVVYIGILLVGCALFVAIPFLVYAFHKPTWKAADFGLRTFRVANQSQKAGIEQQAFPSCCVPQVTGYPANSPVVLRATGERGASQSLCCDAIMIKDSPSRSMNLWSVTALGIGSMVGAGIFALLGQAVMAAGSETYVAFILGGFIALLSGYSYAKLAACYPEAGGLASYFDHAFGSERSSGCPVADVFDNDRLGDRVC